MSNKYIKNFRIEKKNNSQEITSLLFPMFITNTPFSPSPSRDQKRGDTIFF